MDSARLPFYPHAFLWVRTLLLIPSLLYCEKEQIEGRTNEESKEDGLERERERLIETEKERETER